MGRRASRRLVAALLLVALALTVFGLGRFLSHKGLDWAVKFSDIASFVIAAVGLLVAPAGKIAQWLRGPHPPTLEEISAAKSSLHSALSAMWREDRPDAYLDLPMQVRFVATTKFVSTHLASNHPGGTQDEQRLDGDVGSVVDAFAQKPRFRRVILGPAGAGKTVLVTELQRSLLDAQASSDPLPVIVPVASWEPVRESLLDWLAKQLSADYALLTEERARALVASGSVLPILDGLDEMPIAMRPDAIARINEHGVHRPLVVTSRDDEYRAAARVCQTEIRGAATVVVEPLLPADIRAYLEPTGPERWSKVLDEVDANPGEVLATALGNPLMLWLARVVYQDKSPDGLASFDSRSAIEDHLLKEFVPAVYRNHSSSQMSGRFRCSAAQAKWWLSHLPRNGDGDATTMAWWQFGSAAGRWRLLGILMRGAILLSAAAVLVVWLLKQQGNWHDGAYAGPINLTDLLLGGPLGRLIRPTVHQLALALPKHTGSGAQAVISTSFRAIGEIIINPFYLALATLAFVIFGFFRLSYAIPNTPRRIQIRITRILINTIGTYSFIFFSATALSYLLLTSFHRHTSVAAFFGARSTWISLATIALIGLTTLPSTFIQRSDISGNLSPRQSLRLDRQADVVGTLFGRAVTTAIIWGFSGTRMATAYALYALTATLVTVSLGRVDWVASHAFADARLWLAIRGRTPWRTMAFLADANRRGVLRQTGASYQFRHIRLLEQAREWRSAPRPRLFHEWMRRLSDLEDSTLLRRSRQVRAEELKTIRAEAARCWQIACTRPDTLPSNFGETLDSLLRRLWPLRDERDLASLRDLLDAYRTLARANADTHTSMSYARALELASRALPPVDAIRAAEEASQIYRPFAEVNPAIGLSALAEAAQRQAELLAEQGRTDEAEGVARDLVDTCRRLTPTSPPAVLPVLAVSLSDLAVRSWESSPDDSIALRSEAANLYRKLAEDDPARFLKHLISSLTAIAISFKTLRQYDAELVAIREALHAYKQYNQSIPWFPSVIYERSLELWKLGKYQLALEFGNNLGRSTLLPRRMAALNCDQNWPIRLVYRERRTIRRFRRSVIVCRGMILPKHIGARMRDTSPRTAQLQLASALERLSDALDTLTFKFLITGRTADATATAQDAVIAQHQAVNIKRETHNVSLRISENPGPPNARLSLGDPSELARSLDTLALRLKAAGQPDLAETAAREADELRQQSETATITSYSARPTVRPSTSDDAQSALARRSRIPI